MRQVLKIINAVDAIYTYTENGGKAQRSLAIDNRDGLFIGKLITKDHLELYLLNSWSVIQNTRVTGEKIPFRLLSSIEVIPYMGEMDTLPLFWDQWDRVFRYKTANLLGRHLDLTAKLSHRQTISR